MIHLDSILTLMTLMTAALISPGPDFALIVKNSLTYSRRSSILTAFGIAAADIVHVAYISFGVGELLINNEIAMRMFTYIGAGYLIYIGCQGLRAKSKNIVSENIDRKQDISGIVAFRSGFITCLLNPKAVLFLTSIFTVVITPDTHGLLFVIYGAIIFLQTWAWYVIVAIFLSGKKMREKVSSIEHWINRITGGILVILGVKLLL